MNIKAFLLFYLIIVAFDIWYCTFSFQLYKIITEVKSEYEKTIYMMRYGEILFNQLGKI